MKTLSREAMSPGQTRAPALTRREALVLAALGLSVPLGPAQGAGPDGQLTWGVHVLIATATFDSADVPGSTAPFMGLYPLPDAMVKTMPSQLGAPTLGEEKS